MRSSPGLTYCVTSISKSQIDQLGERLKKGGVSEDDLRLLDTYRRSLAEAYEEVIATVRNASGLVATGRPEKTIFAIGEKLRRERTMRLSRMQDVAGCRVVVNDIPEQDQAVERLARAFAKVKVDDRRKQPSHGYRAVHVIATVRDKVVEIQVRTELQNLWAQCSEVLADRIDPRIKYGGGNRGIQDILSLYSGFVASVEAVEIEPGDSEIARRRANHGLEDRKAQLRETLDELRRMFETIPRRVN